MRIYLVNFATQDFRHAQQELARSALQYGGIDEAVLWREDDWAKQDFCRQHRDIAARPRGAGYWLWKPYIIRDLLARVGGDDVVIYHDAGRGPGARFTHGVGPLVEWVKRAESGILPGCYIARHGANRRWTKRDCFVYMDCDAPRFWNHTQVQATYSVWRRTDRSLAFLDEWLRYACDSRILTDDASTCGLPDFPDFVEHRHDQSILTNLAIRHAIPCFGDPLQRFDDSGFSMKDINFLILRMKGDARTLARVRRRARLARLLDKARRGLAPIARRFGS